MSDTHAHASFVRTEMLPEQTPPVTQTGAIKWLRENLFSSWLNAILTILSLYVIYWVISHVAGWMFLGIWDAAACRNAARSGTPPMAKGPTWPAGRS
jgi:general L-amino acid transport system permease protein